MNTDNTKPYVESSYIPKQRFIAILVELGRQVALQRNTDNENALSWIEKTKSSLESYDYNYDQNFDQLLNELVQVAIKCGAHSVLSNYDISHPVYNYFLSFELNTPAPWDLIPKDSFVISKAKKYSLLGQSIGFPIGVPASVLTSTPEWIDYYSKKGFNVFTFKTVRSKERKPHPKLNWVFLKDLHQPIPLNEKPNFVVGDLNIYPQRPKNFSMANSFGVPSFAPEVWEKHIGEITAKLRADQILIVSVMGSSEDYSGVDLIRDYVDVAKRAEQAGAKVIELNLSCPNTIDGAGRVKTELICDNSATTKQIVQAVRGALNSNTKIVIKLSYLTKEKLEELCKCLFQENDIKLIDGISGINTLQIKVEDENNQPLFRGISKGLEIDNSETAVRESAGVSGIAIKNYGQDFVKSLSQLKKENNWSFDIIGMGGVMDVKDVFDYLDLGANAIQTATAAFFNPDLPLEISQAIKDIIPRSEMSLKISSAILQVVEKSPKTISEIFATIKEKEIISEDSLLLEKLKAILSDMVEQDLVNINYSEGQLSVRTAIQKQLMNLSN